jgi:uncharacterized membrane protein
MRILAFAFALTASAALAETPRYYEALARLPIRADPDPRAEELGAFDPGDGPLEITAERDGWGRFPWNGVDAWVPLKSLVPTTVDLLDAVPFPVGLVCTGTEPFWSLAFTGPAQATYRSPDAAPVDYSITESAAAAGRPDFPAGFVLTGRQASAVALIRPQDCSDGMSDQTYPWTFDLMGRPDPRGEMILLTGCCRLPLAD